MDKQVHHERWRLLHQVVRLFELPMMILGLVWIVLLSIDMVRGLQGGLAVFSEIIWVLFAIDFAMEFLIAPKKWVYVKRHWPVAASLAVRRLATPCAGGVSHMSRC